MAMVHWAIHPAGVLIGMNSYVARWMADPWPWGGVMSTAELS
jgi:hypothetical protein